CAMHHYYGSSWYFDVW
nr:immunoglobulin heavy chain junction region [Mus musculus]